MNYILLLKRTLTICFLFLSQYSYCQGLHHKLTISDYLGKPDYNSPHAAATSCSIFYTVSHKIPCGTKGKIRFLTVTTGVRIAANSWIKVDNDKSDLEKLLEHEQGHYNIFEIYSLALKDEVKKMCFNKTGFQQQLDSLDQKLFMKCYSVQLQYDRETDHMRNKEMQIKWNALIKDSLRIDLQQKSGERLKLR